MIERLASAPGKVVLAGEYAALHGGPAISMAVNCRAVARIGPAAGDLSSLLTVGYNDGSRGFELTDGRPAWIDDASGDRWALFDAVLSEVGTPGPGPDDYAIDTSAFADAVTGRKLGFGSSAAVAVALTAACLGHAGPSTLEDAGRAHRIFQEGRGSGVDVATSVYGGVIQFGPRGSVSPLAWPDGLVARILWSGSSASTSDKIRTVNPADESPETRALVEAAEQSCVAWQDGDAGRVLGRLADFVARLGDYDAAHRRGIFDAGHAELVELARSYAGLVYKPSGAGGGDIGMVFSESPDTLSDFAAAASRQGFVELDVEMDPDGVRLEGTTV